MRELVNLTPHALHIWDAAHEVELVLPPSGAVARVAMVKQAREPVCGVPVIETRLGDVEGLPEPVEGVAYVVSRLVLERVKATRQDVYAPGELLRDDDGRPIGCEGLSR